MRHALTIVLCLAGSIPLGAQSNAAAFEVASIKEAPPLSVEHAQAGQLHVGMNVNGGHADYGFMSLADLIAYAFRVKQFQVSGPAWLNKTHWDISTKIPSGQRADRAPEMMQNLLAERFKLAIHPENREQSIYALVIGKGALKIRQAAAEEEVSHDGGPVFSGGTTGTVHLGAGPNGIRVQLVNITMPAFAGMLTQFVDRPVIDATKLKGNCQVTLDLPADLMSGLPAAQKLTAFLGLGSPGMLPDSAVAAIFQVVKELGFELKSRKDPVETIVVDHAEKIPTAN